MRRRLLFSTLAVAVTAVVLFGLPLAFVLSRLQYSVAQDQVQRDASTVAKTLQNRTGFGAGINQADYSDAARAVPDSYVNIIQDGRSVYKVGKVPPRGSAIIAKASTTDYKVTVEANKSAATSGV